MSATERLRELLDERGVEWGETRDGSTAFSGADGHVRWAIACGAAKSFFEVGPLTPEQAVEATLGSSDPREHGLIPHFWTGDETLHIDLGKLPERIDVTLPDPRGREVYSAKVHRFEPERGTCQLKRQRWDDGTCTWGCVCTACDAHLEHDTGIGYNYCPNCGAKVV